MTEQDLLEKADLVFICTPHSRYRSMTINKPIIDVWNIRGNGVMI